MMNDIQRTRLQNLSDRYKVPFDESAFYPDFSLPTGWLAGWIGTDKLYVGVSPEGDIHS